MRRSPRKIVAWLLLVLMTVNPVLGALAIDAEVSAEMENCRVMMTEIASPGTGHAGTGSMADCVDQHHGCTSFCQYSSLKSLETTSMATSRLLWFAFSGEPENFVSRFPDGPERPPRV